jgi:signal transduction histidine kinase/CheY-like chemotaxis protein
MTGGPAGGPVSGPVSGTVSELARLHIRDLGGVYAARQLGRAVAASLALERQDQIRVATAISEIGRSAVTSGQGALITFSLDDADLLLTATFDGEPSAEGIAAASRLIDTIAASGRVVAMTKRRPPGVRPDLDVVNKQLAAVLPSAADELRRQNTDLISALDDLRQQKEQLVRLNSELADTNRGVMALYRELSDELEQTNRGVVALYAELDETSERLRAASVSKDRFWANISHELRTPLNSIIGLTRLLTEPDADGALNPERLYQVELIRNSGSLLLSLVNELLDVAKAESGRLHIDPARVDLRALFGRLSALVRPLADGKPVRVVVSDSVDPDTVLTDEVALTHILRNLLSNGIKYTDRGEVRLSARVVGDDLAISVSDTGIGIPAGLHAHVFEEFYQVPGIRRGGTGLGLPYASRLAAILGGNLELTSAPGTGTTVVLNLPHGTPAVGTVVVADDDASFRQLLKGMLTSMVDRVIEASDGRQALAVLADHQVDLVLADMAMPGLNGAELIARLPASLPAIVITAADMPAPPRAAALLRKDELTSERLEFTIRAVLRRAVRGAR